MEKLLLTLIDFGGVLMTAFMMQKIYSCVLTPKCKTKYIVCAIAFFNLLDTYLKSTIVKSALGVYVMYLLIMTFVLVVFYDGKWHSRVLAFFLNGIASVVAELVCVQILFGGMGYSLDLVLAGIEFGGVMVRAFALLITGSVTYLVWRIQKPIQYVTSLESITPVLILEGVAFVTILMYSGMIASFQLKTSLWSWVYAALVVYVELYIIQMIGMQEVRQQLQEKLEFIQQKDENVQEYYQNLVSKLRNTSELQEEYQQKLQNIYEKFGLDYEPELCAADEQDVAMTDEPERRTTVDSQAILEQVLDNKKREMDRLGYPYELDIRIPENIEIELMDLSSLLNNLLDNAVESVHGYVENAGKTGRKRGKEGKEIAGKENMGKETAGEEGAGKSDVYIRGKSYVEDDMFVILVENVKSPKQKIIEVNHKLVTSKADKTGHGYGVQIIKRIAEKYGGRMEVSYTKERFCNRVMIKI